MEENKSAYHAHMLLSSTEPPKGLREAIFRRIELEKRKKLFCQKLLYIGGVLASGAAVLGSIFFFGKAFITSDFWSLASLMLTDLKAVAGIWQEFILSLLETFPFEAFSVILLPTLILLILLKEYSNSEFKLLQNYK